MLRLLVSLICLVAVQHTTTCGIRAQAAPGNSTTAATAPSADRLPIGIGGCGGIYLLAEPGELLVDVYKRDRNRSGVVTELRAILVGPDREVLDEVRIPDDGQRQGSGLGPVRRARLATRVRHKGVFAVNITVSQDRYGAEVIWGFETNCRKYLIETSRGHRDQRREEPLVLDNPGQPGQICFLPRRAAFGITVTGLAPGVRELTVLDAQRSLLARMAVDEQGRAEQAFAADPARVARPWILQLPDQKAVVQIDGVTRWDASDLNNNLPYWTPEPASFFPLLQFRWLLTPYHRQILGEPGGARQLPLTVHNNSSRTIHVQLAVEGDDASGTFSLSANQVTLPPQTQRSATLNCRMPPRGGSHTCRVRATPLEAPDFTTYSTFLARSPEGTAEPGALQLPLVLRPYAHENRQFGYLPDYPVQNQLYFDLHNRPCTLTGSGIATLGEQGWLKHSLREALDNAPWSGQGLSSISTKIAFDADNDLYVLARSDRQPLLLHSRDRGTSFTAYPIPGRLDEPLSFDLEQFSGHNVPQRPPPVIRYTRTASDPQLIWRRINDLELFLPEKQDGRLTIGSPLLISRHCIGLSTHSGIPSSVVSRDGKVHVVWGEATDPRDKVPGVPTYVVTVDRETRQVGEPAFVAHGPPANDIHNSPSITLDSRGYLHVLAGTHGRPFPYSRSLRPQDAAGGWTEPELVGDGRQTYIGFVCGADDTLHAVFRLWRTGEEPHPLSIHATLAHQRKEPGKPWASPQVLVVAPFSEYSVFYHRLTIDRSGRLVLSYDYWSTYWFYRTDHFGDRRAVLLSPDAGTTWKMLESSDLSAADRQAGSSSLPAAHP